jgi:hypothetical protein
MWPPMFDGFDRHGRNSAAIAAVTHGLDARGTLVGIHPEGTRNKGPDPQVLLKGRGGAGRMVQEMHPDVIVLPFHLSGLTGDLVREVVRNFLPAGRRGPPIRLAFGAGRRPRSDGLSARAVRGAARPGPGARRRAALIGRKSFGSFSRDERTNPHG